MALHDRYILKVKPTEVAPDAEYYVCMQEGWRIAVINTRDCICNGFGFIWKKQKLVDVRL